jgi:hypothetical protein
MPDISPEHITENKSPHTVFRAEEPKEDSP